MVKGVNERAFQYPICRTYAYLYLYGIDPTFVYKCSFANSFLTLPFLALSCFALPRSSSYLRVIFTLGVTASIVFLVMVKNHFYSSVFSLLVAIHSCKMLFPSMHILRFSLETNE